MLAQSTFEETADFYPLSDGYLLSYFQFKQSIPIGSIDPEATLNDFGSFPPAIVEMVHEHRFESFRITFTKGRWDHRNWGVAPFDLALTGVQLHAWFQPDKDEIVNLRWNKLAHSLSGLLGGSINLLSKAQTIVPQLTFGEQNGKLRFGVLPSEAICTENLTPWVKLLPCMSNVQFYWLYGRDSNLLGWTGCVAQPDQNLLGTVQLDGS